MINDRGNIKWTAMMLPEHLDLLKEYKRADHVEPIRVLTEWESEELQQTIEQAINQQLDIKLNVWEGGKYTQWNGIIKSINLHTNELILETLLNTKRISLAYVQSAQLEADYYD